MIPGARRWRRGDPSGVAMLQTRQRQSYRRDRVRGVAERMGKNPAQVSRAIIRIAAVAREVGLEDFACVPR